MQHHSVPFAPPRAAKPMLHPRPHPWHRAFGPLAATLLLTLHAGAQPADSHRVPPPTAGSVGSASAALLQGSNSPPSQDSVVLLVASTSDTTTAQCTGTLIAPSLVITARHCVSQTRKPAYACNAAGVGDPDGTVVAEVAPALVAVFAGSSYPGRADAPAALGRAVFHDGAANLCNHDLAVVWLDRPIVNRPIARMRLNRPPATGDGLTVVGWGATEHSSLPSVRQQQEGVRVLAMGSFSDQTSGLEVPPSAFAATATICEGDSGGPAFDARTLAIVGVGSAALADRASAALTECADGIGIYERLSAFETTILHAFTQAGEPPLLEIPSAGSSSSSSSGSSGSTCDAGQSCPTSEPHAAVWNCAMSNTPASRRAPLWSWCSCWWTAGIALTWRRRAGRGRGPTK